MKASNTQLWWNSLRENILCRWREFLREPSAILFVIIMPPLWIGILGTIFNPSDEYRYTIGVVQGSTPAVVEALRTDSALQLREGKLDELLQAAGKGEVLTVVQTKGEQVAYYLDRKNQASMGAKLYVDNRIQHFFQRRDAVPTVIKPAPPRMRYVDFFIPGLLAFSIMSSSFYGVGMTIVSNRRENLLKRYRITPMPPLVFILSHIIGRLLVLLVEIVIIVVSGMLLFDFDIKGNPFSFLAYAIIGTATFTALATVLSSRGRNLSTCYSLINLITLPLALFSGVWFDTAWLPRWLAAICSWLPLTPLAEGLRAIAVNGTSITALLPQLLLMCAYAFVAALCAKVLFKWY